MLPRAATTPVGLPAALGPAALSVAGLGDSAPQTRGSMHCGTQRASVFPAPPFSVSVVIVGRRVVCFFCGRVSVFIQLNDTEVRIT